MKNKLNRMKQHMGIEKGKKEKQQQVGLHPSVPFEQEWREFQTTANWFEDQYTLIRENRFTLEQQHGMYSFLELKETVLKWQHHIENHPLSARGRRVEELVFFDTETTGLSSGAGNTIFLLGHCCIQENHVQVKQYFLPGPESEVALYHFFLNEVGSLKNLVTYNGKAFDWPQVKTRHTFVRDQVPKLPKFGHFDLLHAARRMWKDVLPSCKLSTVEKEVLKFHRVEDTPSYMVPMLYFDFLQDPDPNYLKGVFQHHEWDVLSLMGLYTHLSSMILDWNTSTVSTKEKYEIARWYMALGEKEIAMRQYEQLMHIGTDIGEASLFAYATVLKKEKKWERALGYFSDLVGTRQFTFHAAIECSKLYEHQVKDFEKAIYYCDLALQESNLLKQPLEKQKKTIGELEQRMTRLQQKKAK